MPEFLSPKTPERRKPLFREGQKVAVLRSNGELQSNWVVVSYDSIHQKYLVSDNEQPKVGRMSKLQSEEKLLEAQRLYRQQFEADNESSGIYMSEDSRLAKEAEIEERFRKAEEEFANIQLEEISEQEAAAIMDKVEIHGDEFAGEFLTTDKLVDAGLAPKFRLQVGELLLLFSSCPYEITDQRLAVMAYVKNGDALVARSYYLSNSHGVWRYLPEYLFNEEDKKINWYGKGYDEISITLPAALQIALARLSFESLLAQPDNAEFLLAGTAKKIKMTRKIDSNPPTYYGQIDKNPEEIGSKIEAALPSSPNETIWRIEKASPESMRVKNPEDEPEFSRLISSAQQKSANYGMVIMEVFLSKNGQYRYLFCRDGENRAWIGGIENDSPYQPVGLRKNWIKAGDLVTSAYDYASQAGGYGNYDKTNGHYVDMFKKYLSKVKLIRQYLESVENREIKNPD